jgi:RNA polymerase sigma-70 factor (ECF subfamily)
MMEAWNDWDRFRGTDPQQRRAWLRQILAHQLAHLARHYAGTRKRDVAREVSLEQSLAQSSSRLERLLPAEVVSPSGMAEIHERQLQIAAVLERLSAEYREVIILRNLEDLSHAEIAQRMNRSEGAVRMLWLRALEQLRKEITAGTSRSEC